MSANVDAKAVPATAKKQKGLTTVEYAVAGGILTSAVILAFIALGGKVSGIIQAIADLL